MTNSSNFNTNPTLKLESKHREALRDLAIEYLRKPLPTEDAEAWKQVGADCLDANPTRAEALRDGLQRALADWNYLVCWNTELDEFDSLSPPYEAIEAQRVKAILENGVKALSLGELAFFAVSPDQIEVAQDAIIDEMPLLWAEYVDEAMNKAAADLGIHRRSTADLLQEAMANIKSGKRQLDPGSEKVLHASEQQVELACKEESLWRNDVWKVIPVFVTVAALLLIAVVRLSNWDLPENPPIAAVETKITNLPLALAYNQKPLLPVQNPPEENSNATLNEAQNGPVMSAKKGKRQFIVISNSGTQHPQIVLKIERAGIERVAVLPSEGGETTIVTEDGDGDYLYIVVIAAPEIGRGKDSPSDWFGEPPEYANLLRELQAIGSEDDASFSQATELIDRAIRGAGRMSCARSVTRLDCIHE